MRVYRRGIKALIARIEAESEPEVLAEVDGWIERDDWPLEGETTGYDAEMMSIFEWREGEEARYVPVHVTITQA